MNTILLNYIVEVEKEGSISKAAENLYMTQPHLSKAIRELEESVGIKIFRRTSKGVIPTQKGIEFLGYAKDILSRIDEMERLFNKSTSKKQLFDIVVPRASYITEAFTDFLKKTDMSESLMFDYRETNSVRAVKNVARGENTLGIIRYQTQFEKYYLQQLDENELKATLLCELKYGVLINAENAAAKKEKIDMADLSECIRLTHGDLSIPSMPLSRVRDIKRISQSKKEITLYERASQLEILSRFENAYMLVSYIPHDILSAYGLVWKKCNAENNSYKDVLIHKEDYRLTELDRQFISILKNKIQKLPE